MTISTRWAVAGILASAGVAVAASPAGHAAALYSLSSRGILQDTLTHLGYRTRGVEGGRFGLRRRAAVVRLPATQGLETDGTAGPLTEASRAKAVHGRFKRLWETWGTRRRRSLPGDLTQRGYRPGPANGLVDGATGEAVLAFERRSHLVVIAAVLREMGHTPTWWDVPGSQRGSAPAPTRAASTSPTPPRGPKTPKAPAAPTTAPTTPPPSSRAAGPMVLGYYTQYSPTSQSSQQSLAEHASQITAIAPLWYSVRANASLHDLGWQHSAVRVWAQSHHVAVYPLVINGYGNDAILLHPALRSASVATLARLAVHDGYAGFNIDFEGLSNVDESGLDAFVTQLAAALHPLGKKVIAAVGPRTSSRNGYHVYNYRVLGQVADQVVLMTYDHHDIGSPAGAVAPIAWVRQIVQYALQEMPAQKILLGLAVYGYNWSSSETTVEIHDPQARPLAASVGAPILWNAAAQEATFRDTAANGTVHQVWYENSRSDAVKVSLANQDHLGGVAIWRLGDETPAFWTVLQGLK